MPIDPEELWPRLPDPIPTGIDEDREIDDVEVPLDVEEPVVGEPIPGIDADERVVVEDDDEER